MARLSCGKPRIASASAETERTDANPYRRWYWTPRWRAIKAAQLRREPYCRFCAKMGKQTQAAVCDHVHPHRGDEARFWAGPFQSLCKTHHDSTKQRMERGREVKGVGEDGWPVE